MDSRSESEEAAFSTPHDVLFRHVFQAPSQARGLLERLLPGDLAQAIDWLLERQLEKRFGPLPAEIVARIEEASVEELDLWAERVLDAASLEEVFAEAS